MKSLASLTVDYFEMNAVKATDLQASKSKKDKKSK
jgi:hypothetical protein